MADRVLYAEDIARYDRYDRLLDIFKAEFPQMTEENWSNDELLRLLNGKAIDETEKFLRDVLAKRNVLEGNPLFVGNDDIYDWLLRLSDMKMSKQYPVWRLNNKPVIFVLNGRVLPVNLPPTDTTKLFPHPATDELQLMAKEFWNISAKDIAGIELMSSIQYTNTYTTDPMAKSYQPEFMLLIREFVKEPLIILPTDSEALKNFKRVLIDLNALSMKLRNDIHSPVIIEITTRSGITNLNRARIGTAKVRLQGFNVPRQFYIPKYYPDDIASQAEYDMKPTLYWNPEVVTDREGKAEITFPVGLNKRRGLQIRVEGIDLNGGIGSITQGIVVGERK
jgi:hypothetical protein